MTLRRTVSSPRKSSVSIQHLADAPEMLLVVSATESPFSAVCTEKLSILQRPSSLSRFLQNHLFPALYSGHQPEWLLRDKNSQRTEATSDQIKAGTPQASPQKCGTVFASSSLANNEVIATPTDSISNKAGQPFNAGWRCGIGFCVGNGIKSDGHCNNPLF